MENGLILQISIALLSLGVTVALAIYGVRAALATFKAQRTWERRVDAYADLLERIAQIQLACGVLSDRLEDQPLMGHREERDALYDAHSEYNRARTIADLLLPGVAKDSLHKLTVRLEQTSRADAGDLWNYLADLYICADNAKGELTIEGAKQLGN